MPLTAIDARGGEAARKLGRVQVPTAGRTVQAATFNSSL
ncbi:FXSXX-COOH protein [Streptomyces sp. SID11233]|nr:FXSXX-COOH protein [Streptomyces sp. SID11233]